ncbi:MAG: SH3 domain-containing protein [Firmicutes bacterium]|nr:SH3 domain-containing protein [Bacillota bacterium]
MEWGCGNGCYAVRTPDGRWVLRAISGDSETGVFFDVFYCGIGLSASDAGEDRLIVGTLPWRDLFATDVSALPQSAADAAASLTRDGWAVVNNPDPADRLHLRERPDKAAPSLGKFYNKTPVQVLERRDGWARVRIGTDGRLEGWMMEPYLAFGSEMDQVTVAFPKLILRDGDENGLLYAAPDFQKTTGIRLGADTWVVGVIGDESYILLDAYGNTGYLPQSALWGGYG